MKRLLRILLVTLVAAPFATTMSLSAQRCVALKDGVTATISGVVMENSTSHSGGTNLLVKMDNPCDAIFAEIAIATKEKVLGCKKDERVTATGKVAVGDPDYGEAALLLPSSPPVCRAK